MEELGRAPSIDLLLAKDENNQSLINYRRLEELSHLRFMFKVEGIGRSISKKEQIQIINRFDGTPLREENVDLKEPQVCFHLLDDSWNNNIIFGR